MRILVTGASGFAGSQLIPRLLSGGHAVQALARDPARVDLGGMGIMNDASRSRHAARAHTRTRGLRDRSDALLPGDPGDALIPTAEDRRPANVDVLTGDVLTGAGLAPALRGVEVAYYLIHSMERSPAGESVTGGRATQFSERERVAAENFAAAAAMAGVRRIVYLGGPTSSWLPPDQRAGRGNADDDDDDDDDDDALSPHLRSREAVERILRKGVPDTVALRASIVIGARSRSFRLLVRLIERMPVLALPAWRSHRTRPIDARDVTDMLVAAATVPAVEGSSLDVGGPEILSYGEMIRRIAELMMLARPVVGLGVNATPLTAHLASAIAGEDPALVGALMGSLQSDLLPGGLRGRSHLRAAELLGVDLHSFDAAVERSLREWESVERLAAR